MQPSSGVDAQPVGNEMQQSGGRGTAGKGHQNAFASGENVRFRQSRTKFMNEELVKTVPKANSFDRVVRVVRLPTHRIRNPHDHAGLFIATDAFSTDGTFQGLKSLIIIFVHLTHRSGRKSVFKFFHFLLFRTRRKGDKNKSKTLVFLSLILLVASLNFISRRNLGD